MNEANRAVNGGQDSEPSSDIVSLPEQESRGLRQAVEGVAGWLTVQEQELLCSLGKSTDGPILEVGCYQGKSTICFAYGRRLRGQERKPIHTVVDLFCSQYYNQEDFEQKFRANLAPWQSELDLRILRQSSFDCKNDVKAIVANYDGIFIDADHTHDAVMKDIALAVELLKPGGWLAFHDAIRWEGKSEVFAACWEHSAISEFHYRGRYSSILLLQKPTDVPVMEECWKAKGLPRGYHLWVKTPMPALVAFGYRILKETPFRKFIVKTQKLNSWV